DFDVNVSDTVVLSAYYWDLFPQATDSVFIVDSIADFTLNNNQTTNVFYLSSFNTFYPVTLSLIEGVGSVTNPFGVAFGGFNKELRNREFCCPRFLLCLTLGEEQRYVYNDTASCGKLSVWTSIDAIYSNTELSIYPNPLDRFCTIKISPENTHEKSFKIYSIHGEEIYATRFFQNDIQIDLSSLKPGIYISQLWQEDNLISTRKIIVSAQN
ncbi:MAG: T9SS type A sorting domain-containing protein, partial [Bacteroidales bacterium]|nr:T9SS type A sorting domain-containing protein [Bacteroidales bacterium]